MIIALDMDGTICEERQTFARSLARPLPGAVEAIKELKAAGHRVIVYTARGWAEYEMTKDWLSKHGVQHDELIMGKPIVDVFVDDRAVRFTTWGDMLAELPGVKKQKFITDGEERAFFEAQAQFLKEAAAALRASSRIAEYAATPPKEFSAPAFTTIAAYGVWGDLRSSSARDLEDSEGSRPENLEAVILNNAISHAHDVNQVMRNIALSVQRGAKVFVYSPWGVGRCSDGVEFQRFSVDGITRKFSEFDFEVLKVEECLGPRGRLMPVSFRAVFRRE